MDKSECPTRPGMFVWVLTSENKMVALASLVPYTKPEVQPRDCYMQTTGVPHPGRILNWHPSCSMGELSTCGGGGDISRFFGCPLHAHHITIVVKMHNDNFGGHTGATSPPPSAHMSDITRAHFHQLECKLVK